MTPLVLTRFTATSCLGPGVDATLEALRATRSGLTPCKFQDVDIDTWVGVVPDLDSAVLTGPWRDFNCRNNRLAHAALAADGFREAVGAAVRRLGAERVGVFIGSSTSGILETEVAYRHLDPVTGALPPAFSYAGTHNMYSAAAFTRAVLGLEGPAVVVSTACSSSAKVFSAAARMIELGLIDAAVVGGVDTLCLTTLYGFQSLQLTAPRPCRPFAADRDGISIGEAAAFALLERPSDRDEDSSVVLLGVGESNDGYHLSTPHPQGLGARLAMQAALSSADVAAADVGYVNLHGTGTLSNDSAESIAVTAVLGTRVPCSSTKGASGHALGAAGALEAVICALALRHRLVPGGANTEVVDPALTVNYATRTSAAPLSLALSNSFGFGGTNCSLLLGRRA